MPVGAKPQSRVAHSSKDNIRFFVVFIFICSLPYPFSCLIILLSGYFAGKSLNQKRGRSPLSLISPRFEIICRLLLAKVSFSIYKYSAISANWKRENGSKQICFFHFFFYPHWLIASRNRRGVSRPQKFRRRKTPLIMRKFIWVTKKDRLILSVCLIMGTRFKLFYAFVKRHHGRPFHTYITTKLALNQGICTK